MINNPLQTNGEVKLLSCGFAEKVYRDWLKSKNPETLVTCKQTDDVSIILLTSPCCRSTTNNVNFSWDFQILTRGKHLQRIALTMDQNRINFALGPVVHKTRYIGITNGQEWCNTEIDEINSKENTTEDIQYFIKILFATNQYGTYRQNIIFYFGDYPVMLQRLCMDCLPTGDLTRITEATNYQFSQNPESWTNESSTIHWFKSPFVPAKDPKEDKLSRIYPYPDRNNFMLTQESLTDDSLTPKNYRGRLHELITVEELARHEQIARYNETSYMRLLNHYILSSTGDASTTAKYAPPGELFAQLPLGRSISEDTKSGRLFLRGCNKVLFNTLSHKVNTTFEAYIEDKCTQTVYVRLSKECVQMLNLHADTDLHVRVQFLLNRLPFCEWHKAVDSLPDVGMVFLNREHMDMDETDVPDMLPTSGGNSILPLLNMEQKRALAIITAPKNITLPPILLLGPFGTGKTFTIAQALRILLTSSPEHKILLCTHSNSAADLYVKDFFDVWYKYEMRPRLKPVRIYYKGRARNTVCLIWKFPEEINLGPGVFHSPTFQVHPVVQEYSLMKENGTFRDPVEEDLRNCNLIVTTLATSDCLTCLNLSFTHIVIDEAAQALECEVLIPLALANRQTRLVLAGDQMQLAPEIYSDLANERGLGVSLLERIYGMYSQKHPCRIHLYQNYRSLEDITRFTSEMFYDGVVNPVGTQLVKHPVLRPLTFYAVEGVEVQDTNSTGYVNMNEVFELVNRVQDLRNSWPTDRWGVYGEKSIGVLAYYAEQVQRIRAELRERKLSDVSVERVLNMQGKQFTAVFISTVRTRHCCKYSAERNVKDYGFLTNPRLLNTAITRAKCLVAVIGDPVALWTIGSCRKLWQRYLSKADMHGMDWSTLIRSLYLEPELPLPAPLNPLAEEFVPRRNLLMIEYVPISVLYPVLHYPHYAPYSEEDSV